MLVVNRKDPLHRPESKHPDLEDYPNWILDCSDLSDSDIAFESVDISPVLNLLTAHNSGLILNDVGPSLPWIDGVPAISLLTGSDLTYYGSFSSISARVANWSP